MRRASRKNESGGWFQSMRKADEMFAHTTHPIEFRLLPADVEAAGLPRRLTLLQKCIGSY
jgi:hypothetical protein